VARRFFFFDESEDSEEFEYHRSERETRAREAAEATRKLQDKVIHFISINLEFFIAPCTSDKFGLWAHRRQFSRTALGQALQLAAVEKNKFMVALQGDPDRPETLLNALVNGDDALIRRYFNQYPKFAITLSKFFNDPIIEEWYRTKGSKIEPTDLPLNKIQHATYTYLKYLEKKICGLINKSNPNTKVDLDLLLQHKNTLEILKVRQNTDLIPLLSAHLLLNESLVTLRQCSNHQSVAHQVNQYISLLRQEKNLLAAHPGD
jgi:hypothetical protein